MSIPLHILVVDDQPDVAAWLKAYFESLGHRVEPAGNGIEALNFITAAQRANDRYQLVLLDVHMPLLDGLGVVRELRRAKDYVDVALFTGNHALLPQLDTEAQRHGCLMVMPKPLDPAQLAQLAEFVGMRQGRAVAPPQPPQPSAQTTRVVRPPAHGYDPFLEPVVPTAEYSPTAIDQAPPPAESQVAYNARRTQQFFPADRNGHAQRPAAAPLPPVPGVPQYQSPRPATPGYPTQRPVYPAPLSAPPPAGYPPQAPQRPAYPTPRAQQPPYPAQPPAQQFPQRGTTNDPRYTSRVVQPPGYDPRQNQGLAPMPAPVAQPTVRRDSRLGSGLIPPPTAQPPYPAAPEGTRGMDPRRTSRVGPPLAPPLAPQVPNGLDPRRSSGLNPPAAPPRATPLEDPSHGSSSAYAPHSTQTLRPDDDGAQSSRMRRSIGGASTPQPPSEAAIGPERSRLVACAYCRGSFRAVLKAQPYNLVCVHCGQLNRIDP